VPAGFAWIGDDGGPSSPRGYVPPRRVSVEAFDIEEKEVTVAEYERCVAAGSCRSLEREGACGRLVTDGGRLVPVPCAGYGDAETYCASLEMRLPTEAEWIRAARGDGVQPFPWGAEFDGGAGNFGEPPSRGYATYALAPEGLSWRGDAFKGLAPPCSFPAGRSTYGLCDLAGNLAEWVETMAPEPAGSALLKGGSWLDAETSAFRIGSRSWLRKDLGFYLTGFRCARTAR
jgi:formylglycine-generating enzyme required for sulfatase activity